MSNTPPRANISAMTIPYAEPTTSGGTAAVTTVQKNSPRSTKISTIDMGSIIAMSPLAPCSVSYAMGTEPVMYVSISPSPAEAMASPTMPLRLPTSSMAETPEPNENATMNTPVPESELP